MNIFHDNPLITGLGARTPLGATMDENWQAVLGRRTAISLVDRFALGGLVCQRGGLVNGAGASDAGLATAFALAALREAVAQSGIGIGRLGLIAGSNFGETDRIPCDHAGIARRLATALGLGGPIASLSLSCASGAAALALAGDWIACGRAEAVAVVGVDAISLCAWSGLCSLRTMARDALVKPFDIARGGTVFAEGACALILERASCAAARGATPLAELRGWATGNNGFHLTAPPSRAAGSLRVMRDALGAAGAAPSEIAFVSAHATATKANDLTEAQALEDLFGDRLPSLPVTAVKAASGHLLGAAGTFEAAIAVLSLREGSVPPLARTPARDPALPVLDLVTDAPRHLSGFLALTNSAGFGGCNAALILASPAAPAPRNAQKFEDDRIAICSSGFLSALGIGTEEAAAAWIEGESACFPSPGLAAPASVADDTAGVVPPFAPEDILPSAKAYLDRQGLFALTAAALALRNERPGGIPSDRFGISHGTAWGPAETLARFWADCRDKGPRLVKPMLFPHTYANAAASLISIEWELRGFHANFAGGANASSFALAAAVDALRRQEADAILAGGSEALSPDRWTEEAARADCPPGEGAAFFLLRRGADIAPGTRPLACLSGIGFAGGGDVNAAVSAALAEAGIVSQELARIFSSPGIPLPHLPGGGADAAPEIVVAEKMTGRCGGASAAIQLACALLDPPKAPFLILTADEDGTCVALLLAPWERGCPVRSVPTS